MHGWLIGWKKSKDEVQYRGKAVRKEEHMNSNVPLRPVVPGH